MKKNYSLFSFLVCTALIIGISCGKSGTNSNNYPPGGGGGTGTSNDINIYGSAFSPATKTVSKGAVVKWTNSDAMIHTASSDDGTTFDTGNITSGASATYTANVAGTFKYHCKVHGLAMAGTLIVNP